MRLKALGQQPAYVLPRWTPAQAKLVLSLARRGAFAARSARSLVGRAKGKEFAADLVFFEIMETEAKDILGRCMSGDSPYA